MKTHCILRHTLAACATAAAPVLAADGAATPGAAGMLQMLPGLALVLALIAGLAWLARRAGVARMTGVDHLKLVAERAVGTRERVVVLEVAGQWLVLGVAPGQVRPLAQMARPAGTEAQAPETPAKPPFAAWLERALKKS